jgi:ribosomal protein S8
MCVSNNNVKYCRKHDCSYVQRGSSDRTHCRECTNERNRNTVRSQKAKENKREIDRKYQEKKRLHNPDKLKEILLKHKQTDKFRDTYIKKIVIKSSNIYCIRCNNNRVYNNDNYCNDCNKLLHIINNHDYISVCKHCNKEYGLDTKINNNGKVFQLNKYCSTECNNDYINIKKQTSIINLRLWVKSIKGTLQYKLMQRDRKTNGTHKRRVIKRGSKYEVINRRTLFQRFNYICQGCNVKCVYPNDVNYNDDNCATIDHIKPISKGGSHTYDNTQLLCRKCNWMKKDNEKYFKHKQMAKQMELQFDLNIVKHGLGEQLSLFQQGCEL